MSVTLTRRHTVAEAGLDPDMLLEMAGEASDGKLASAFVRATKPLEGAVPDASSAHSAATSGASSGAGALPTPVARRDAKLTRPNNC